jgi:glucose dehydrogenase
MNLSPTPPRQDPRSEWLHGNVAWGVLRALAALLFVLGLALAVPAVLTRWEAAVAQSPPRLAPTPPIDYSWPTFAASSTDPAWFEGDVAAPALDASAPAGAQPVFGHAAAAPAADEWAAYGGSNPGQRYAQGTQITRENVGGLEPAWTFRTGDMAPTERVFFSFQNTPLKIGDSLYVCSSSGQVFALHPAAGVEQWHFDPAVPVEAMGPLFSVTCRAVAYHEALATAPLAASPADGATTSAIAPASPAP